MVDWSKGNSSLLPVTKYEAMPVRIGLLLVMFVDKYVRHGTFAQPVLGSGTWHPVAPVFSSIQFHKARIDSAFMGAVTRNHETVISRRVATESNEKNNQAA